METIFFTVIIITMILGVWLMICNERTCRVLQSYIKEVHKKNIERIRSGDYRFNTSDTYEKIPKYEKVMFGMFLFTNWRKHFNKVEEYLNAK